MKTINKVLSKIETEIEVIQICFKDNKIICLNTFTDCILKQKICDLIFLKRSNIKSEVPILTTYYN